MKNSIKLPLATIPAFVVTATSLLVLLATVVAASKPGDLLYSLRGPAVQIPFLLSNDSVPAQNPVAAPMPAGADEPAPEIKTLNSQMDSIPVSSATSGGTQGSISEGSDDVGPKEIESQRPSGTSGDNSGEHSSGGSDDSSSSNKGKK